ncbi:MAG: ATP-binding protein [Bryobacteraceae bacterium]
MLRSFRLQLTAWHLLFLSLVFLLFSVFVERLVATAFHKRFDQALRAEANTAIGLFGEELAESGGNADAAARETVSELRAQGRAIALFEGARLLAAGDSGARFMGTAPGSQSAGRDPLLTNVAGVESEAATRLLTQDFEVHGRRFRLIAGESLESVDTDLRLVRRVLLLLAPAGLLIVGLGGFVLATRSLAPVRRMAEQAKRITDRDLSAGLRPGASSEELQALADSFNELLSRLDLSFATMRRFVADASHELRTPLSVIRGEADVALGADRTAAEYKESMTIIQDEARRLTRLVDDLLNLACADSDAVKLQVEAFYLNELLVECCRSAQGWATARQVELECRCPEDVMFSGDQPLLRRLVLNLLDNAIRYTPEGGTVSVGLEAEDHDVRIAVSDTGIGIPPEAIPHVFERFYRVDQARSREHGGFGLGLSIVKWIAECHKGRVDVRSKPGAGSTFTVLLPAG